MILGRLYDLACPLTTPMHDLDLGVSRSEHNIDLCDHGGVGGCTG